MLKELRSEVGIRYQIDWNVDQKFKATLTKIALIGLKLKLIDIVINPEFQP